VSSKSTRVLNGVEESLHTFQIIISELLTSNLASTTHTHTLYTFTQTHIHIHIHTHTHTHTHIVQATTTHTQTHTYTHIHTHTHTRANHSHPREARPLLRSVPSPIQCPNLKKHNTRESGHMRTLHHCLTASLTTLLQRYFTSSLPHYTTTYITSSLRHSVHTPWSTYTHTLLHYSTTTPLLLHYYSTTTLLLPTTLLLYSCTYSDGLSKRRAASAPLPHSSTTCSA
jgi:hypothetical protein